MTISSTVRIAGPFIGTGTATVFPFAFKVFTASNLQVVRADSSTGLESTLILNTDYTVSLNTDQDSNPGGNVTLLAFLATGFTMVITSDIANLQPTDLTNQGGFYPEVITDALDRATIQIQQMADELTRSIKIPISDGLSLDMELPTAAARANSFLAFDATGEPTVVTAGSSGAPTSITRQQFSGTGSQVAFTLASDPGALGNSCEVFIGGIYQQRDTYTIAGTTLTFTAAPVAGTDNIEIVNFLTSAIGTTDSSLVTFVPAGTGATMRTAQAKMRDVVSVKDFGAVGDGVADDRAAIQAAINSCITLDRTLFFPSGVYAMSSFTDSASGIQIKVVTPANALRMEGDSATIKSTTTTQAAFMFYIQGSVGKDLSLKSLTFDANLKSQVCFRHDDKLQGVAVVEIDDCIFQNGFGIQNGVPVGATFWISSVGLELLGGYKFINLTNSQFTNFKRDPLTATINFETAGVGIGINTDGGTFYPQNTNVSGCYFNDINNNQTLAVLQNANADGLKIFGGLDAGASYIASTATISNNHFINCQGRAIKVQNDEAVITGNTVRYAVQPISGGSGQINCQLECGIISNNVFHYDLGPGATNPFANPGVTDGVGSSPLGFFPQVATTRARMITVMDNIVLNNVPQATGYLSSFMGWSETTATALPVFATITGNKISGPMKVFATPCTRNSGGICSSVIQNNMMTKLTHAFLASSTACNFALNKFEVSGNVNATATAVPHLVSTSDYTTVLSANFNAARNQNIGVTANLLNQNEKAFLPRVGTIVDPAYGYGGGISVQSQIVENNATYAFPASTYQTNGASLRMLTSSWGGDTNFLFLHGDNTLTSVAAGSLIAFANSASPDTPSMLNVWIEGGATINIKNLLGSSRVFTLFTLG